MPQGLELINPFKLNLPDTTWHDQAACRNIDYDPAWWFKSSSNDTKKTVEAKRICNTECSVREKCLRWILELEATEDSSPDVYGGMTQRERRKVRLCRECLKPIGKRKDKIKKDGQNYSGKFCSPECDHTAHVKHQLTVNRRGKHAGQLPTTFYIQGHIR